MPGGVVGARRMTYTDSQESKRALAIRAGRLLIQTSTVELQHRPIRIVLRYILGYSPTLRLLARLSLRANARLGKALALSSALGWVIFVGYIFSPSSPETGQSHTPLPGWLMLVAFAFIFPAFFYGRALAERDLEARIDTDHGLGRRWRWALALQFWGIWAYWLIAPHQLPEPRQYIVVDDPSQDTDDEDGEHATAAAGDATG